MTRRSILALLAATPLGRLLATKPPPGAKPAGTYWAYDPAAEYIATLTLDERGHVIAWTYRNPRKD